MLREIPESAEASALAAVTYPSILGLAWRLGVTEEETAAVFAEGRGSPSAAVTRCIGTDSGQLRRRSRDWGLRRDLRLGDPGDAPVRRSKRTTRG